MSTSSIFEWVQFIFDTGNGQQRLKFWLFLNNFRLGAQKFLLGKTERAWTKVCSIPCESKKVLPKVKPYVHPGH